MKTKISPSLLAADFTKLGEQMSLLENSIDSWHFDVMDGQFVPNISMGIPVLESIRKATKKPIVAHLMIEHPEDYVEKFASAGADIIEFHIETAPEPEKLINQIHELGKKAGIALNPDTALDMIFPYLKKIDVILIMSVNPGFGGQEFIDVTEKIKKLRKIFDGDIEVDGGLTKETAPLVKKAGANVIAAGSSIFKATDILAAFKELKLALS
jgi:ribulose-phosphate 3-epimerase